MSQSPRPIWVKPLLGLIAFLAVTITLAVLKGETTSSTGAAWKPSPAGGPQASVPIPPPNGAAAMGLPDASAPVKLEVPAEKVQPTVWVDVKSPAKVREALFANEWLQTTLKHPLGQGFAGPWAAFLGSKGDELKASFSGTVLSLLSEQLLSGPFQVVWFGPSAPPVVVVHDPGSVAEAAYEGLDSVARRGVFTAPSCPGESGGEQIEVVRWLLAEHAVYAATRSGRMVLGRQPSAVLNGLCAELPPMSEATADLEVAFAAEEVGRDLQAFAHALGLGRVIRLQLEAQKATLVPKGLAAVVAQPGRLDAAALSEDLLKAVPEATPVLLMLQMKLPKELDADSLKAFWKAPGKAGPVLTRQVAVLWSPRGDRNLPTELALLWSRPEDGAALEKVFTGGNALVTRTVCKQLAIASSEEVLRQLEAACAGKVPNALHAAPAVLAGLRAPASVSFGVNLGRLLSQLTLDGYWSEAGVNLKSPLPKAAPPEIEQARTDLGLLPFLGFSGSAQEKTWVPGGFRS